MIDLDMTIAGSAWTRPGRASSEMNDGPFEFLIRIDSFHGTKAEGFVQMAPVVAEAGNLTSWTSSRAISLA